MDCTFITDNLIKVEGIFVDYLVENTFINFMITNFFVDVRDPMTTESWVLTVYTPDDFFVDTISSGLVVTYNCKAPCEQCNWQADPPNPDFCLTCNVLTGKSILYEGYCYEYCPSGTYYDDSAYTCKLCHESCRECSQNNGNECTACNPFGEFPFLDGTTCKKDCPFGTYGNTTLSKCMPCESPC